MTQPRDPYQLRTAGADDFDGIWQMLSTAFGNDGEEDQRDVERLVFEPERSHVITFGEQIVGHANAYSRDLSVPGATVPAAHVSLVSVEPTHHRRGLLRRLMTHQLSTAPEPIAVLWATEGGIYQRFGYGLATKSAGLTVDIRETTMRTPAPAPGSVRGAVPLEARKQMQEVYDKKCVTQPGLSSRDERWWDAVLSDPESARRGMTGKRVVLFDNGSGVDGYAIWRAKSDWDDGGPKGLTRIVELVANTPEAYSGLWHFLLGVDLARSVRAAPVGAEEPILYLVNEPRRLHSTITDGLWLRVIDVPAALAGRRYSASLDLVVEITDTLLPSNAGRWRLKVADDGTGTCAASTDAADLSCDITDLGAVYLGGTPWGQLAQAGRVREVTPDALRRAAAAFSWPVAPTAIEVF